MEEFGRFFKHVDKAEDKVGDRSEKLHTFPAS
jgi:hypothetical protein